MNLVFIHGHRATTTSFNFIRTQFSQYRQIFLQYDSGKGFYKNQEDMLEKLHGLDDIFFVAHSLGGIHALHLANQIPQRVIGGVTISTPYGGSEAAEVLAYVMPFNQVLRDIHPRGIPISASKRFKVNHPWTNIVSVKGGSPLMAAANDGVVTLDSMRSRDDMALIDVGSNHYEILLNPRTIAIIRRAIKEVNGEDRQSFPSSSNKFRARSYSMQHRPC